MTNKLRGADSEAKPGHRMARRILEKEAYRRILVGAAPETLSEFAAQLSVWFKDTYTAAPAARQASSRQQFMTRGTAATN